MSAGSSTLYLTQNDLLYSLSTTSGSVHHSNSTQSSAASGATGNFMISSIRFVL
jgi:hypothetical protein